MKIVTWNVSPMYQAGKLENIFLETKRMGIDIMGLAEVRWLQSGKIVCNDHTLIYSGHKKDHKHGVELTELSNMIHNQGSFPNELNKSIFITLPQVNGTIKYEKHRTIKKLDESCDHVGTTNCYQQNQRNFR